VEVLFAFLVSFLPRRYWRGASGVGILFSGLFQLGVSLGGLVSVYTRFSQDVSDTIAEVTIEAAYQADGSGRLEAGGAMAMNALTPLGFLAVSRTGAVLAYLVFSSLVRLLGFATDHPCGDPLLTVVDSFTWDFIHGARRRTGHVTHAARSLWRSRAVVEDE
jgi:hypothetical protein